MSAWAKETFGKVFKKKKIACKNQRYLKGYWSCPE